MFSDSFTGGPSRRWISTYFADFTNNNAKFTDASSPFRGYLRTLYAKYGTTDFVATVKLTNAKGHWGAAFFGIGEGIRNGESYGAPSCGDCVYLMYHGHGMTDKIGQVLVNSTFDGPRLALPNQPAGTTIGVQLTWVAATGTATFRLDTNNDGVYDDDAMTVVNPNLSLAENHTRLFVGGAHGVIVDDFSVAPLAPATSGAPAEKKPNSTNGKGTKPMN